MAYNDGTNSQVILTTGAISGFLVLVLAIGLQAWYSSEEQAERDREYLNSGNPTLVQLKTDQQTNITTYRWVDKQKTTVAIPISQAMEMLIQNKGVLPTTQPR